METVSVFVLLLVDIIVVQIDLFMIARHTHNYTNVASFITVGTIFSRYYNGDLI